MKKIIAGFGAFLLLTASAIAETALQKSINEDYAHLDALFKHLHTNPELSFQETETAARLASELRALGYSVTTGVGKTGVVGVMKNGDGPTVMVRADMDALPIKEDTGLPYASTKTQVDLNGIEVPVMHACGHDMHVTALVGTAMQMATRRDEWQGTLMLIGQPAEEMGGGAKAMIEDGLYERFGVPDYALALHSASADEAGIITYRAGTMYSSADSVKLTVYGVGTHGASPQLGKDPIVIASQIVTMLQTLVTRDISPLDPAIVTVGSFQAGSKSNIIPDHAELLLTVRTNSDDVRATILTGIERIAKGVAKAAGVADDHLPALEIYDAALVTMNDQMLTDRLDKALHANIGPDRIVPYTQRNMAAEDFTFFSRTPHRVPGFYFMVGGTPKEKFEASEHGGPAVAGHHSPFFQIAPEPTIKAGVEAMTVAAIELLAK